MTARPANALSRGRIRTSLSVKRPQFQRNSLTNKPICNKCQCDLPAETTQQLRDTIYPPIWLAYHWKTFLCQQCKANAARLGVEGTFCYACVREFAPELLLMFETQFCKTNDTSTRRPLYLCEACVGLHHAQLRAAVDTQSACTVLRSYLKRKDCESDEPPNKIRVLCE